MQLKSCLEQNRFSELVYGKPVYDPSKLLAKLRYKRKTSKYYKKMIKPVMEELTSHSPSFECMCDFADFIKQMEMVIQYRNCIDSTEEPKLVCDNSLNSVDKKVLIYIKPNDYTARFMMKIDKGDQVITIRVKNAFGKELTTDFTIVNANTEFGSIHHNNLLHNININLQREMANTLKRCYDMIE